MFPSICNLFVNSNCADIITVKLLTIGLGLGLGLEENKQLTRPCLSLFDRFLTMLCATKAAPIIIINLVSVELLHELTETDYSLFNQSYRVHSHECPWGRYTHILACGQKQFQVTSHVLAHI